MRKKIKQANEKKNSTPLANQATTDVKIVEGTSCVVNYNLIGSFAERQSNAASKEEIRKMLLSPFLDENRKGRFICSGYGMPGKKLGPKEPLPKNYYTGTKPYKPCRYYDCYEKRVYNTEALLWLSSIEGRPYQISSGQWNKMNTQQRLMAQFTIDANSLNSLNPGFTFEFIN